MRFLAYIFVGLFLTLKTFGEEPIKVKQLLIDHIEPIEISAQLFNISPRLIASVIYTERTLNVNWMEGELDMLLAKSGYSSSIGLGQIKIHTAEWIEKKLHDSTSKYFLGESCRNFLPRSTNRDEIISKLNNPNWNIKYVSAYITMFCRRWDAEGFSISEKPEIIGTLYCLGPYRVSDGSERKPHGNPKPNYFGKEVEKFYMSNEMLNIFPINLN